MTIYFIKNYSIKKIDSIELCISNEVLLAIKIDCEQLYGGWWYNKEDAEIVLNDLKEIKEIYVKNVFKIIKYFKFSKDKLVVLEDLKAIKCN